MKHSFSTHLLLAATLLLIYTGCEEDTSSAPFEVDYTTVPAMSDTTGMERVNLEAGLHYYVIEEGSGIFEVQPGYDEVRMFYTFWREDGTILTSTYTNARTTPQNIVVYDFGSEGARKGMAGMKRGERRLIVVPPNHAYGNVSPSNPNYDLRDDILYYEVEVTEFLN
ncbi:MAG: FKBP-type peptidyl-prolyl cis-trans isomerase [Balneolaceae bacterium]